ncbi:fimbrial protein [Hafnia alvei]|uniref:Major type 1 subunit fimbrin (Pilin) n=1 Tax=Hafnia alvei TaxID=569 RepID=A0A1C6Z4Y0_HAFAL|nr:fimbrial protein [Hafnia alvei]NLS52151.1 fimbrial protein [Hafnia alvei]SCM54163.1 major type 1 subunit fimbrin (pilin) [Hafnia alvei]
MKYKLLVLSMLAASSFSALASDGDITFVGTVSASACTLKGFNGDTVTSDAAMTLPTVTPSSFNSAFGYAGMMDFTIDLKDCDKTTLSNAEVTFSGSPDAVDNNILKNGSSSNPATGVGVALLENDGTTLVDINGGKPSKPQALSTGNTTLRFKVAYKANTSTPEVSAGSVTAKTFIDIMYN